MLVREQIVKMDILAVDETMILTAGGGKFSLQTVDGGINDGDTIMIIKGVDLPEIGMGTALSVVASTKNGKRIKYPSFVSLSTSHQLNIIIRDKQGSDLEERRRYYKIDVDISCVINSVERGEDKDVLSNPYLTQIRDLNIGGIFLCMCSEPLELHDKLSLTINLDIKTITLDAEILRIQRNAAGGVVGYGCRFVNITPAHEDVISRYVFQLQRDRLQKEMQERT